MALYKLKRPIFDKLGIENEITKALRRKVNLSSGGYICIDHNCSSIAIDVNTGKFTGKKQLEDTVFQHDMEAAEEIARQVRLRDMGGIIVCDFIDMQVELEQAKVDSEARRNASGTTARRPPFRKRANWRFIEMTRKRVKHNIVKALSQPCPYCEGSGVVRSVTTVTFDTLRQLQSLFCSFGKKEDIYIAGPSRRGAAPPHREQGPARRHRAEVRTRNLLPLNRSTIFISMTSTSPLVRAPARRSRHDPNVCPDRNASTRFHGGAPAPANAIKD